MRASDRDGASNLRELIAEVVDEQEAGIAPENRDPIVRGDPVGYLEQELFAAVRKHAVRGSQIDVNIDVWTKLGSFRPDVRLTSRGKSIILELDGREYHKDFERDVWRDAALIEAGFAHAIYRLPGNTALHGLEDCLHLVCQWEPWAFESHARNTLLPSLAHRSVVELPVGAAFEQRYFRSSFGARFAMAGFEWDRVDEEVQDAREFWLWRRAMDASDMQHRVSVISEHHSRSGVTSLRDCKAQLIAELARRSASVPDRTVVKP